MAKINEVLRLLSADGWYLHRHGSRHDLYRHKTKEGQIPIPRHGSKEVAPGTLNSILKKAGLK
ncbi:type II toxin-antitoxin system HicA family toxin [Tenacibaculum sp. SSH1-16]|uniref:type II toxin-antitoxin system HicA family toxin n=1 Tax=Tenacibaculum sp. SSH1-16 TaxID=3136667 RepID=UPI0032C406E1|nr:type II toxin-antitoxin system HicA family toxin [Tenacibaculum mesophilum]